MRCFVVKSGILWKLVYVIMIFHHLKCLLYYGTFVSRKERETFAVCVCGSALNRK